MCVCVCVCSDGFSRDLVNRMFLGQERDLVSRGKPQFFILLTKRLQWYLPVLLRVGNGQCVSLLGLP